MFFSFSNMIDDTRVFDAPYASLLKTGEVIGTGYALTKTLQLAPSYGQRAITAFKQGEYLEAVLCGGTALLAVGAFTTSFYVPESWRNNDLTGKLTLIPAAFGILVSLIKCSHEAKRHLGDIAQKKLSVDTLPSIGGLLLHTLPFAAAGALLMGHSTTRFDPSICPKVLPTDDCMPHEEFIGSCQAVMTGIFEHSFNILKNN